MKKRLITILVLALVMVLGLTSCDFFNNLFGNEPDVPEGNYAVYFIANGGTHVSTQEVKGGGLVTRPEDPTREGYTFENWYKDAELTILWNFETDTVTQNTMIYAKWTENPHECESVCPTCGKCTDTECTDAACADKCEGHVPAHTCESVCTECGKCTDTECTDAACADKCQGHVPAHECESVCAECGKCTDAECTEDACADKCQGHTAAVTTKIVLDPESEDATAVQGPQTLRIGDFEIILSSEKSRIESKNATFTLPDDSSSAQNMRINFNGSATMTPATSESGKWENAIKFVTNGKGTVTIYWTHGGKADEATSEEDIAKAYRDVAIWDENGNLLDRTNYETTKDLGKEDPAVTTFTFDAAGTYYIGNLVHANYFFYVEVSYEGEKVSLPALPKYNVHFNTGEGSEVNSLQVEENSVVEKPEDPTREGYEFGGWYKDEACTEAWSFSTDRITTDTVLYAKWTEVYTGEYEDVHYELNISNLETGTRAADEINGKFTIVSGTEIRNRTRSYDGVEYTKSVKIGGSSHMIKVSVPGDGTLKFIIQNGSSGAATQFTKVIAPDGTVHDIEFAGVDEGSPLVMLELAVTEGEWTICRGKNGGTQDIYFLSLDCSVPVSPEVGFELVDAGKVDYIVGEELDISKLVLNATFESGKTEPLAVADVTVDSSAFNKDAAGTYTITVSYKEYTAITYTVNVFAPEALKLDFDAIEKLAQNTSAGNGVYFNHSFKEVYAIGEELDLTGLSVTVVAKCGEAEKTFRVTDYTVTGFDSTEGGEKVLTVSYGDVSATVTVYVANTEPVVADDGVVYALVDPAYLGLIGNLSGTYHIFNTIQQALDFLARVDASVEKELCIVAGQYNEKLEITIPNLTIKGWGEKPEDVVIEWDSLYGLVDAGGFTHTTDSTATVAVRESATNVTIENLTISNYWNSQERMDAAGLGIERGLALLVQADRFIMKDSRLLGIQDTLELFTGRQYFENVFISGYTDFIFGTNNTTYFKNCTIHVIDTSKDDAGTAGYLTAFKGMNKNADDAIVYGAIFDGCKFTADEGVTAGKTAIGRTWGAYAAVAVINSEIGGHISLDGYDSSDNKNKRYISMNGIHPTDETVQFVEYNNTGDGAITEAVAGMRMLTAEEAAKYADFATIFGTTNGKVSYLDPWDPNSTDVVVDDRTYYYFDQGSSTTGTSHTFDTTTTITSGSTLDWEGLHISAENGKVAWNQNGNALNMKAGAFISFDVAAGTTVSVTSYPGYNYFTINGIGTSANTLNVYFAEATTVTVLSVGDLYLYNIIINPDEEAPEAATLTEVKVDGMDLEYLVGEELALDGVSVEAHYSDNSVLSLEYTVDTSAVDNTTPGEYEIVFTAGEHTIKLTVVFVGDYTITESTTIDLSATGAKIEGTTGTFGALTIDATSGKFADNGSGWTQVNKGTIISFEYEGEAEVSVTAYSSADSFDIVVANGVCTITATANDYLKAITVNIVVVYGENTTIDLSATGANIQGSVGTYEGLTVDATSGKFADNNGGWVQVNAGTVITLNVLEGAEVSVTAYTSADNFTITVADGVCTITCNAGDYLKAITVKYAVVYGENTTIDLSATGAKIEGAVGTYEGLTVDATSGKFADNNGGWVQVNAGTVITLNVLEGAEVSVTAYSSADNFTITVADGVCTITCNAGDYLSAITVAYAAEPVEVTYTFDAGVLADAAKGDKADCETELVANFFTIHYGKNSVVEANPKTFGDGYVSTKRFTLGGKATAGTSGKCCVEFTATEESTVKIWWVSGGNDRLMTIFDEDGTALQKAEESVKNTLYITEFTVEAGTYFIGGDEGSNYIYQIVVVTTE